MSYKKWAFQSLILIIFVHLLPLILTATFGHSEMTQGLTGFMIVLSFIGTLLFPIGLIFLLISILKKERKDLIFWVAAIGYILLLLATVSIP